MNGVIHCFGEDYEWAKKWLSLGFYLGINGLITYPRNEHVRKAVKSIGPEYIFYETDSPFLPIQKNRGSINTPEAIPEINDFIANILNMDRAKLAKIVFDNTKFFFKI